MIPAMMAVGGGMAAAGLIGGALSGANKPGRKPDKANYTYDYKPEFDWTQAQQDYAAQQGAQGGLMNAAEQARLQAEGKLGPSLAELQMRSGLQRAAADSQSVAANARGGAAAQAAAQRQAMAQGAATQSAIAQTGGMQRLQEQEAARGRELAALQGAGGLATQMRQGSMGMQEAEVGANMQAARFDQEGRMSYDQGMQAADEAARKRKAAFWGKLVDTGASIGTMGLAKGGGGGGGDGGGGVTQSDWNAAYVGAGGDPRYMLCPGRATPGSPTAG